MSKRITPTFLLRGVDPNKVLRDYQNGKYTQHVPISAKVKLSDLSSIIAPTYGADRNSGIYSYKDKNNVTMTIATSNHKAYEIYNSDGGEVSVGGRCRYCLKDFTHRSVGIPIKMEKVNVFIKDENDNVVEVNPIYKFWVEDLTCCSYRHALGLIRANLSQPVFHRDSQYNKSEEYLKLMYRLETEKVEPLRCPNDPRLSKNCGGSMDDEEFEDERYEYLRTNTTVIIPAKVEYIRHSVSDHKS